MTSPPQTPCVSVMYDGSCPLCTREIAIYRKSPAIQPVQWVDVSSKESWLPQGASREQLMQRFHVVTAEGTLVSGAAAFVHLWRQLPGWRHLARVCQCPGVIPLMDVVYDLFLRWRPHLQRWAQRKDVARDRGSV